MLLVVSQVWSFHRFGRFTGLVVSQLFEQTRSRCTVQYVNSGSLDTGIMYSHHLTCNRPLLLNFCKEITAEIVI